MYSASLCYRTAWCILMKLGMTEVLKVPSKFLRHLCQICQGTDPGRDQNSLQGEALIKKKRLLQIGRLQQQSA